MELVVVGCVLAVVSGCNKEATRSATPAVFDLPADGGSIALNDFNKMLKAHDQELGNAHSEKRSGIKPDGSECKQCDEVEIQSIGLTTDIDEKSPPPNDRIVARMANHDETLREKVYKIGPKAKGDHYLWVSHTAGSKGETRWTVVAIDRGTSGNGTVHYLEQGSFARCGYDGTDIVSEAKWDSCARAHPGQVPVKSSGLFAEFWGKFFSRISRMQIGDSSGTEIGEDPAWIRCANGCCTASNS
jgi:hypothetical protein